MNRIAAIVLAAGASRRMGGEDKLTRHAGDRPLLRRVTDAALKSCAEEVVVVLGAHRERREAVLSDGARIVVNEAWRSGMASSIRTGIESLGPEIEGVLIVLGDMPEIGPATLNALIAAFSPDEQAEIIRPHTRSGVVGNPVLFARRHFPALCALKGDMGAKSVIAANTDVVRDIPVDDGVLVDLDTPEAWAEWQRREDG